MSGAMRSTALLRTTYEVMPQRSRCISTSSASCSIEPTSAYGATSTDVGVEAGRHAGNALRPLRRGRR